MTNNANSHPMKPFTDMMQAILTTGTKQFNERTKEYCYFIPGYSLKYDMADGFPAPTFKKAAFKAAKGELFGFFRGYTSAAEFRGIDCKVWDGNANETKAWLANPNRKGEDDIGRAYGAQWTDWLDWREVFTQADCEALVNQGYEIRAHDVGRGIWVMRRGINQLEESLRTIMTNPSDRGIIVTGWRPDEFDQMCLRPCHVSYQLICEVESKKLHLCLYQRSYDTGLAFNAILGALYLHIFAKLSGYTACTFTHFVGDAHVYEAHIDGVKEMLSREQFEQPTIDLGNIPTLTSVDEIPGIFTRLDPDQINLVNYQSHGAIKLKMAT